MIAHLRGRLLEKQPNRVIVDVNGVGYDVHVPLSTFYEMAEPGEEIALRIHTHVREDALLLYGFATVLELQIFERLDQRQRHRSEARARGALGDRAERAGIGDSHRERGEADRHSGHRQENRRADRARAERQDGVVPAGRNGSVTGGHRGRDAAHRRAVGSHEPRVSPSARRARSRRRLEKSADSSFESVLKHALRELAK